MTMKPVLAGTCIVLQMYLAELIMEKKTKMATCVSCEHRIYYLI